MAREHKFERAPKAVSAMLAAIVKEHHKPLHDAKVRFDVVFCRAETNADQTPKGFALKKNGKRCLGIASAIPLLDRAMGRADAQIKIDADWWGKEGTTDEMRNALLDHEVNHFEIKKDEVDAPKSDDLDRPILSIREHDWEISGFKVIAERYGAASVEVMEARELHEMAGQVLFSFALEPA
jgi:hypothetical protein